MEETLGQQHNANGADCIKVVLFGPESTGKTTLAMRLAKHYQTVFVPEYSRIYAEMQLLCGKKLTDQDVLPIAEGQMRLENELVNKANKVLICDTDLLETKVYSQMIYKGFCPAEVEKSAIENHYDLYLLCNVDVPWEPDSVREMPDNREAQFEAFKTELELHQKPYIILEGDADLRFQKAVYYIDGLLNK